MRQCIIANDAGIQLLKPQHPGSPKTVREIGELCGVPVYRDSSLVATEIRSNCRFCEFDKSDQWAVEAGLAQIVELPGEPVVMSVDFGQYMIGRT